MRTTDNRPVLEKITELQDLIRGKDITTDNTEVLKAIKGIKHVDLQPLAVHLEGIDNSLDKAFQILENALQELRQVVIDSDNNHHAMFEQIQEDTVLTRDNYLRLSKEIMRYPIQPKEPNYSTLIVFLLTINIVVSIISIIL